MREKRGRVCGRGRRNAIGLGWYVGSILDIRAVKMGPDG